VTALSHSLRIARPPTDVRGIALVLHGGQESSTDPVRPHQLAVLRMLPFARRLASAGRQHGLAVARLQFGQRGWNGELHSPVSDARAALADLTGRFPDVPIALVGHSMGGRTAVHVAGDQAVRVVAALAPWITPSDPVDTMAGRRLLVVHGEADRITDPRASRHYAEQATALADSVSWVGISGEKHAMLRKPRLWHDLVTGYVLGALLDVPNVGTVRKPSANLVEKVLAGQPRIVV
jgi:alpha-beta hydrolase superfamily lysophospholipase